MRKLVPLLSVVPLFIAGSASAAIVYSNVGLDGIFTPSSGASIYFDDATVPVTVTTPFAINQVDFGYENVSATPATFDLLVQFYNTVNYAAAFNVSVGTNAIGSLVDIHGLTLNGSSISDTGLVSLLGNLPISTTGTFGFEYEFVKTGATAFSEANANSAIVPLFRDAPPLVGSSDPDFAYDYLNRNTIVGDATTGDIFTFSPGANAYASFGSTVVPEPASISAILVGGVTLLSRRKRIARPTM